MAPLSITLPTLLAAAPRGAVAAGAATPSPSRPEADREGEGVAAPAATAPRGAAASSVGRVILSGAMARSLSNLPPGFDDLSIDEKLDYVHSLWDRIFAHPEDIPVPDWHLEL